MPDKTTLVLRNSDDEVIDTITTTLPSEIASLRSRGYATPEDLEQLAAARKAAVDAKADEPSNEGAPAPANPQTTSSTTDGEDNADKPATRGGKKSPTTGR